MLPNYSYVIFTGTIFDNAVVRCPCAEFYGTWRVSGAIIGGAVGGRRGAAIGAATGAGGSRHQRHWRGHYYWRHGQCWVATSNGRSHPVSHRYCR